MSEQDIFLRARAISSESERNDFVNEVCGGNLELLKAVKELLAADATGEDFLEAPHPASAALMAPAETERPAYETTGTVVADRYKLLQRIGEGGMGSVWMADQIEPIRRRVAIKLVRPDRDGSRTILRRFEAERQAIALMDHPNIAKLLDAGETNNRPFFVMELVKGTPLTEYCDQHRLDIPARLSLFIDICSAVQHAHQKGVIHRDLKPTNVLVESHDGRAVPKVIDFGLAKASSGIPLTDKTLFTTLGVVAGTPLYMAPEQAVFNAIDVDTRADIYALGVILYELLTGTTPIERAELKKAAYEELLRVIRDVDPPSPSQRLSSSSSKPSVAANRNIEPAQLDRLVKGELDWIVMKALSKERDRRYESAASFARDVDRYLADEPVTAGPPSAAYRLRKFIRRHRGPVTTAALVFLALVAGVIGTTWGLVKAEERRQEADRARQNEATQAGREREARAAAESREKEANLAREQSAQLQKVAETLSAESARRLQNTMIADGFREWEQGDHIQALMIYRAASHVTSPAEPLRKSVVARIGLCLSQCPDLVFFEANSPCGLLSPDGHQVASRSGVYDTITGRPIMTADRDWAIATAAFPDSGATVLMANREGRLKIWNNGKERTLSGVSYQVSPEAGKPSLTVSPDGTKIAVGGDMRALFESTTVKVFDAASNSAILKSAPALGPVLQLDFGTDSALLLTRRLHGECRVDSLDSAKVSVPLQLGNCKAAQLSSDSRFLGVVNAFDTLELYSFGDGTLVGSCPLNPSDYRSNRVVFSADNRVIYALGGDDNRYLVARRTSDFSAVTMPSLPRHGGDFAVSPDSAQVLASNQVWDLDTGRAASPWLHDDTPTWKASFSSDGRTFVTGGDHTYAWRMRSRGQGTRYIVADGKRKWGALSKHGRLAASNMREPLLFETQAGKIHPLSEAASWGFDEGQFEWPMLNLDSRDRRSAFSLFSNDSSLICCCRGPKTLQIWNTEDRSSKAVIELAEALLAAAFDSSGQRLACLTVKGVYFYDTTSGAQLATGALTPSEFVTEYMGGQSRGALQRHAVALAFSPDDKTLVAIGGKEVHAWSVETGEMLWKQRHDVNTLWPSNRAHPSGGEYDNIFSADGRFVALTPGSNIQLLNTATGVVERTFSGTNPAQSVRFSPDGSWIIRSCILAGEGAHVWNVGSSQLTATSLMQQRRTRQAAFSPDGSMFATIDIPSGLTIWETFTGLPLWTSEYTSDALRFFDWVGFGANGEYCFAFTEDGEFFSVEIPQMVDLSMIDDLATLTKRHLIDAKGGVVVPDRGTYDEVARRLLAKSRASSRGGSDSAWHREMAEKYEREHQLSAALFHVSQLIQLDAQDLALRRWRSRLALAGQRADLVIKDCSVLLTSDPRDVDALQLRGSGYATAGKLADAVADFAAARRIAGDDPHIDYKMAILCVATGDIPAYQRICRERLNSATPITRMTQGVVQRLFEIAPDSGVELAAAVQNRGDIWPMNSPATFATEFRLGKLKSHAYVGYPPIGPTGREYSADNALRAIVMHQQGHDTEASKLLALCRREYQQFSTTRFASWERQLCAQVWLDEAAAVLTGQLNDRPPPPPLAR